MNTNSTITEAATVANSMPAQGRIYVLFMNDGECDLTEYPTQAARQAFLDKQDFEQEDIYLLDVFIDGSIGLGRADKDDDDEIAPHQPVQTATCSKPSGATNDASVSAIFLWDSIGRDDRARLAEIHGGQIGLADWLVEFSSITERIFEKLPEDLPGVFHYEIVDVMGVWLAKQESPTPDLFKKEIERITIDWLKDLSPDFKF